MPLQTWARPSRAPCWPPGTTTARTPQFGGGHLRKVFRGVAQTPTRGSPHPSAHTLFVVHLLHLPGRQWGGHGKSFRTVCAGIGKADLGERAHPCLAQAPGCQRQACELDSDPVGLFTGGPQPRNLLRGWSRGCETAVLSKDDSG